MSRLPASLARQAAARLPGASAPTLARVQASLARAFEGPSEALDTGLQEQMSRRFGHHFGQLAVHADDTAARAADALGARAFTQGRRIYFGRGEYRPRSADGQRLLVHELTHVAQQRLGGSEPCRDGAQEQEAARNAALWSTGAQRLRVRHGMANVLAFEGKPPSAAHAGGSLGENDAAFGLGKMGFEIVMGPAGPGGHALTARGLDIVAYNPKTGELWITDNKASGGTGKVDSASALTRNLKTNLTTAIAQIRALPEFGSKQAVLGKMQAALDAVSAKQPLPAGVSLVITNAGGFHTGIGKSLSDQGVRFVDLMGEKVIEARKADVRAAEAAGQKTGRPASHEGTKKAAEAAREQDKKPPPKPVVKAKTPPAKAPVTAKDAKSNFRTSGDVIHTERDGSRPPPSRGPTMRSRTPQRFNPRGAGLAQLLPAAMNALQDKVIRHRVASDMLGMWSRVEDIRRRFPNDTIVFLVSLQEWAHPDPTGQVARAVNYVDVFHGATEADAIAAGSNLLRRPVPEGWVEVGPFAGVIHPTDSLAEAREHAESQEGCFIATACCGSEDAVPVATLRAWRDLWLMRRRWGRRFVGWYYRRSPPLARWLESHAAMRTLVRIAFVRPAAAAVGGTRSWWTASA